MDPDDHHVFVSLGCATENLIQAGLAHGLKGEAQFDAAGDAVRVSLEATRAQATPSFAAIAQRQCTRGDYDGKPLSPDELALLQRAGSSDSVRLLLLTERPAMEQVLDHVIQGNTAQMADAAFVKELKAWIPLQRRRGRAHSRRPVQRFFRQPEHPDLGRRPGLSLVLHPEGRERQVRATGAQLRRHRGVRRPGGRQDALGGGGTLCYERFALQATALGIRNAFLNQPVEVAVVRSPFAAALGIAGQRPDLVVRFGRGPTLPRSLRRPVESVMV